MILSFDANVRFLAFLNLYRSATSQNRRPRGVARRGRYVMYFHSIPILLYSLRTSSTSRETCKQLYFLLPLRPWRPFGSSSRRAREPEGGGGVSPRGCRAGRPGSPSGKPKPQGGQRPPGALCALRAPAAPLRRPGPRRRTRRRKNAPARAAGQRRGERGRLSRRDRYRDRRRRLHRMPALPRAKRAIPPASAAASESPVLGGSVSRVFTMVN